MIVSSIVLCIPSYAEDQLSIEEAIDLILDYHNIETDIT